MSNLMRNHVGLRKLAGAALAAVETRLDLAKERSVQIDAPVGRKIERPHRRLRETATAQLATGKKPQPRRSIFAPARSEDVGPGVLGIAEHCRDKLSGRIGRRADAPVARTILLLVRRATTDGLGAADQYARIDAERPSDQAEHDYCSNTESAATDRHANAAAITAAEAAGIAVVFDIVAAAEIIPTHQFASPTVDHC